MSLDATGSCIVGLGSVGLLYSWRQVSGPTVVLSDASSSTVQFESPAVTSETLLQFEMSVRDAFDKGDQAALDVLVLDDVNEGPVADAGIDQQVVDGQVVVLDASGSSDPNDDLLSYAWRQLSGPSVILQEATSARASFVAPMPEGTPSVSLGFELWVRDESGATSLDLVEVQVAAARGTPVFVSRAAPTATLGVPYAYDEDGTVLVSGASPFTYGLRQGPAGFAIDATTGEVRWTPSQAGVVSVTLTAENRLGRTEQAFLVQVYEAPRIVSPPNTTFLLGVGYYYRPEAEGTGPLRWSLEDAPDGLTVDAGTGSLFWLPTQVEPVDVTLVAQNDLGEDRQAFTVARPLEEVPRISGMPNATATVGQPYAYDTDGYVDVTGVAVGEQVELRAVAAPAGMWVAPRRYEVGWLPREAGKANVVLALVAGEVVLETSAFGIEVSEKVSRQAEAVLQLDGVMGDASLDVRFDGSASRGADDAPILQYAFSPGDGSLYRTTEGVVQHRYERPGGYQASLEVVDALGTRATAKEAVFVTLDGRVPPSARIEADVLEGRAPLTVRFGCDCQEGDAPLETYLWEFGDGNSVAGASVTHTFERLGSYQVRLTVDDAKGLTGRDSVTLGVGTLEQRPPVARIVTNVLDGDRPLQVSLRADVKDADGVVEGIAWILPDGSKGEGDSVRFGIAEAGYYSVGLEARDNDGLLGYDTWTLRVRAEAGLPPRILTVASKSAVAGEPYRYNVHSRLRAQGSRPLTWKLGKLIGEEIVGVPRGMVLEPETGVLSWTPDEGQLGMQSVALIAENAAGIDLHEFAVEVFASQSSRTSSGGCRVGSGTGGATFWCFWLFGLLRLRLRMRMRR